jgi:hypothetical protein
MALPLAWVKLLLIPLGVMAFLIFLLILGALALAIALGLLSLLSWLIRIPTRHRAKRISAHTPARRVADALGGPLSSQSHPRSVDMARTVTHSKEDA